MPNVKVANPARILSLVNPVKIGGGKKMRKRKPAARRARKPNPQKRVSIKVNGRRKKTFTRRKRNPAPLAGLEIFADGTWAAVGGLATVFARSFVPISFGGAFGDAAVTGGLAYLLGILTQKVTGNNNAAKLVTIGGVTVAVTNLLTTFGLTPQRIFAPQPQPQAAVNGKGMSDIGLFPRTGNDPYYGSGVRMPRRGMADIGTFRR